jgi:ABC-2 type transport system ATP-binding protein
MIEVQQLSKRHGGTLAVDRLTFRVEAGRVTGFLGPNGAGKSTTMRMMLGLDRPTAGKALLGGVPYRSLRRPLKVVGSVLDSSDFHGGRTAWNHLAYLAVSNDLPRSRVAQVLELTGLGEVGRKRVKGFSLGMRQRLGIAAALLGDPQILVMDEPINGLDPEGIVWIRTLLKTLAAEGRTVFVSSHLISEMAVTADHLIVIGHGRLLADMGIADLLGQHANLEDAYLRVTNSSVQFCASSCPSDTDPANGTPTS